MEEEIWKDVVRYEGLYQVSNYGRIRSLLNQHGNPRPEPMIMKLHKHKNGYLQVALKKNKKKKVMFCSSHCMRSVS